jgi:uncharacterized damage-inducible protein DinB
LITAAYVSTMARYNAWQNNQLMDVVKVMDQVELDLDRGAFFGSIQATLSHVLWADTLWMSRLDAGSAPPDCSGAQALGRWPDKTGWATDRFRMDGRIRIWADGLRHVDLSGTLTWTYSYEDKQVTEPLGFAITHFFNHQTHHRGQVHAMLSAAGRDTPVSDLSYLPKDA